MFVFLLSMVHKGEIIEEAIRSSGLPISHLAKKLRKSRQWMYVMFQNPNVSIETIQEIGKIINHDFSDEIKGVTLSLSDQNKNSKTEQSVAYWREKYFTLLEEYHEIMKKMK